MFGYRREEGRQYGDLVAAAITPEVYLRGSALRRNADLSDLLPQVSAPTLVLHHSGIKYVTMEVTRDLAARLPAARMHIVEGTYADNGEELVDTIDEFLGESAEPAGQPPAPGGLVTILFTDIEASTSTRQRLGDAKAQELLRTHNTIVRGALVANGGSEIKHTGDGIMASFPLATGALACAIAIQQGLDAEQAETPLRVYIGLNAGEPIAEEGPDGRVDLFGTSIDLAARICDKAQPGEILVSDVVRQLAAGKEFLFSDLGETELRGFEDPVKLWEVRWREEG